jgi:hypothetical protein
MPKPQISSVIKAVMRRQTRQTDDKCEGPCDGECTLVKAVKGKCPDPCKDKILGELIDDAREKAKKQADELCKSRVKNGDCACKGKPVTITRTCETFTLEDCGDICVYYVTVFYSGDCEKPAK